jgi:REP-associated tyrosine transposase
MPRRPRITPGGFVYHVLNRGIARTSLFERPEDYALFERLLFEARGAFRMRMIAFCLMPNHWHLVLWPEGDRDLSIFMHWLTGTHAKRWHAAHGTTGNGVLYQNRFKAIAVQTDRHLLWVWRYVERNPARADLVSRAEDWRWSSLWHRQNDNAESLDASPIPPPSDWTSYVNLPQTLAELTAFRRRVQRGTPFGGQRWARDAARALRVPTRIPIGKSPLEFSTGSGESTPGPEYAESANFGDGYRP